MVRISYILWVYGLVLETVWVGRKSGKGSKVSAKRAFFWWTSAFVFVFTGRNSLMNDKINAFILFSSNIKSQVSKISSFFLITDKKITKRNILVYQVIHCFPLWCCDFLFQNHNIQRVVWEMGYCILYFMQSFHVDLIAPIPLMIDEHFSSVCFFLPVTPDGNIVCTW